MPALAFYSTLLTFLSVNFPLSSKTWGLRCLPCNVPGHRHLRQLRDAIQAQFKDEGVVLCDVIFEEKNYVSQHKLRQKKFNYLMIGILFVFDPLVG